MAIAKLSAKLAYILIFLTAGCNVYILSYDGSMINNLNIIPSYLEHFNLDATTIGINAALISAGCIIASPFVSPIVDKWGRKAGMAVGSCCIILGVILQASAKQKSQFLVGRLVIGLATEFAGSVAPMWVMELGSPRWRGILVNSVLVTVPITAAIVCGIILGVYDVGTNWAWRSPILGEAVPAIFCLIMLPFVDESPRWLISKGRREEALEILIRLHADGDQNSALVHAEYKEICDTLDFERSQGETRESWRGLIAPASNFRRFSIAVLTNIGYNIVGGNMILYFSSFIIVDAGITEIRKTLLVNLGLLIWNIFATAFGAWTIDRFGRKFSFIWGTTLMIVCFALLSILVELSGSRQDTTYGIGAIVVVGIFLLGASCSWMILAYTYPPEVLRYSQRAKGVAVAQAVGYAFSFLNLYTAPIAIERISWRYYAINGGWDVIVLAVVVFLFVETRGKTLEEIDQIFDGTIHTDGVLIGDGRAVMVDDEDGKTVRQRTSHDKHTSAEPELKAVESRS